jgi:hypothetical protein
MSYGYVITPQTVQGDFVFAMTYDSSNFEGLESWGVIPASAQLTGGGVTGLVQSLFPGRPYFQLAGGTARPMGNSSAGVSYTTGDIFSIHRIGNIVRFFKNFHTSAAPVPLLETTYGGAELIRFYAELGSSFGTADIQGVWGSIRAQQPRAYNYTATQQVEDFGSTQSSIKVRVMQESAILGRGDYIERNL